MSRPVLSTSRIVTRTIRKDNKNELSSWKFPGLGDEGGEIEAWLLTLIELLRLQSVSTDKWRKKGVLRGD